MKTEKEDFRSLNIPCCFGAKIAHQSVKIVRLIFFLQILENPVKDDLMKLTLIIGTCVYSF